MSWRVNRHRGFTVVELLVVIGLVVVLAVISLAWFNRLQDRAYQARCLGNLRGIIGGAISFATDRNGMLWTRTEVGYSKYRMIDDPLGLPKLLEDYVSSPKAWLCPGGRKSLKKFGNNYTWSAVENFEQESIYVFKKRTTYPVVWDTYNYSLPSMFGASDDFKGDGTSNPGPTALGSKFFTKPHIGMTSVMWACVDGNVYCGKTLAQ